MKRIISLLRRLVPLCLVAILVLSTAGCAVNRVMPLANRQVAGLGADDIVRLMQAAGFTEEQVLEFGTDLRNHLALSGAAQIKTGNKVEAIYAVHGNYVHISSRRRGSFVYDITSGRMK